MVPRSSDVAADARSVLLRCLDEGLTGALEGETPLVGPVAAYVMMGEIVAARSDDDDETMLRLLVNGGHLGADEARSIRAQIADGTPIAVLFQERLPEDFVAVMLFERFRENLSAFLRSPGEPTFTEMDAVFVENIQVGHDSRALVEELVRQREELASLEADLGRMIWPGQGTVTEDDHVRLVELCAPRVSIRDLLARSPWERGRTLVLLKELIERNVLESESAARRPRRPVPLRSMPPKPIEPPIRGGLVEHDDHTEEVPRVPTNPQPPGAPRRVIVEPVDIEVDDELAAFGDYDTSRGDGSFIAQSSTLDRVEVLDVPEFVSGGETIIETAEADAAAISQSAIRITFEPPRLGDDEAQNKIDVVSEVLATVVSALDETLGTGVGLARVQVLIEGTSGAYAAVFAHVELLPGGRLPADRVLRNLKKRPAAEQRHLLNGAMSDVIERALSLASSCLDDRRLEAMLERIAGFQSRIGV